MSRPAKSVMVSSGKISNEEKTARAEEEKKLRGADDKLKPPAYLSKTQKKFFKFIVDELKKSGILGNLDIYILACCSIALDRMQEIESAINEDIKLLRDRDFMASKDKYTKDFYRCCSELCLSPQARAKLAGAKFQKGGDDALERLKDALSDE